MARCLITGAAGFIASHLVDELIKHHEVTGVDNLSGGYMGNLQNAINHSRNNGSFDFYETDLRNEKELENIFRLETPDIVYHIAADATEGRSQFTPISSTQNNLLASVNVFTMAIKYGVKRIIFTSSMSVYGDQEPPFTEDMETRPVDVYGTNKAAAERILKILSLVHDFEYVILRPHNVFGERQNVRDAYRNVVGIFMNRIMQGKPPIIYGNGEQVRSFTYIDNITPCILKAMECPSGEIINIGPTETQTINYLAEKTLEAFESELEPQYMEDRPLEVKHAHCSVDKAKELLDYKTIVPFEEGIKRMAEWVKDLGPKPFRYLDDLEIPNSKTPLTWSKRLM